MLFQNYKLIITHLLQIKSITLKIRNTKLLLSNIITKILLYTIKCFLILSDIYEYYVIQSNCKNYTVDIHHIRDLNIFRTNQI